ncbi:hypothetical protein FPRO05_03024 [Fusarium proliferatum]|uniref:F-box domain-containing protein n=1 Tax=Gibberella intermedia TaxID=948311 RepID=A0A365N0L2_GIBIN|nr:hypothetical protein FPRO05_03024 [Fusarium proliferatum]
MANRNPNAALDRMPMELLLIATEDVNYETLKTLTLVCKRLRLAFLPQTASRVTVAGNVPQMTSRLTSLLNDHPYSPSGPMSQYIKQVIHVHLRLFLSNRITLRQVFFRPEPIQMNTPTLQLPRLVGKFCRKAVSLQKVTVTTYDFYKVLEVHTSQIKRLAFVDLQGIPGTGLNPRLTTSFLNGVETNFKQLECLILGEFLNPKFAWGQHQFRDLTAKTDLNTMILKVIMVLRSMPKLTRFAFVLSEDTIGIRGYSSDENEWNPWTNDDGKGIWYAGLVHNISGFIPGLEQLCIRAQPSVYCHGIRGPGEPEMAVYWETDREETDDEFDNFFD